MKKKLINFLPIILIFILSFFALKPLLNNGFFPTHDDTQPSRIFEMLKSLKMGMFPVRWVKDLGFGYGYPIFNFYAPLVFYLGAFISYFGFNFILSTKILIVLSILISAFSMYILCKEFFGKWAGVIGSIFYVYATYHAVEIYVRGDLTEYFAYSLFPFLFWGIYKIYLSIFKKENLFKTWIYFSISSFSYFLIVITHNLSAVIISPFILLFVIILFFKNRSIKSFIFLFSSFILGSILSAFYSIPALVEINLTNVLNQLNGGAAYYKNFVCLSQFWYSQWGYGGSIPGCFDGMSFMIGKLHIIFAVISLLFAIIFYKKIKNIFWIILFSFICFFGSIFIQTSYSSFIWKTLPVLHFIQYPWRFLMITSFFSSILTASFFASFLDVCKFKYWKIINLILFVIIIFFVIFLQSKFFKPQKYLKLSNNNYISNKNLNWKISNISHEYLLKNFVLPKSKLELNNNIFQDNFNIYNIKINSNLPNFKALIFVKNNTNLILNLAYFPFWHVTVDNKEVLINNYKGRIEFNLISGKHTLNIFYKQTNIEVISDLISLSGFGVIFIGIIFIKLKYDKKNT